MTPSVKCNTIKLDGEKEECITDMRIYTENLVDRIEIKTSLGNEYVIGLDDN